MDNPLAALTGLAPPDGETMSARANAALTMARQVEIASDFDYSMAGEELQAIKGKQKRLAEQEDAIKGPLNQALRAVRALFKGPTDALAEAERVIKSAMIGYQNQVRVEREAALAEAERVAQLALVQASGPQASEEAAAAAVAALAAVPAVPAAPRAAGISKVREIRRPRVVDKAAFLAYIAQAPAYLDLADPNDAKLNALFKALGDSFSIPGVEVAVEQSIAARAA